ncbi:MAG TPA: serine/threonine-protein kinase [Streptosporangiaceae bacterium]|nr:serine/threonine-protein kinase [Streptosporangiaceae bacterium]
MSEGNRVVPGGFAPGSRIAGYLLEEQIGQGGMAVVFRAHDERLDRRVALKILAPALAADEAFRQRFIRESRAAAAVDDPHIIPVFEAGEASGVLFIAMRFVRGGDVRSLVAQFGPLPPGRVAEITSQVASALDAAHGRGLVHRDVKPANMLLDASSGSGRPDHVYLSDFGLSKGSLQASGLTGTGTFLGTLDYISPEQIEGKPVDGRADEYALACAAFELLTGVPPFQRDEAMAVMYAQLSEPPPAVTGRRPDLAPSVDAVFAKALAKAPADRYPNCREFSDALREAFGIRPYDSGPGVVPSGEHPQTQVVRPSGGSSGGAAGTAAAGAAGYAASGFGGPSDPGGQGAYGGPAQGGGTSGQGWGGSAGPGGPGGQSGPPVGAGSGGRGGYGAAETQVAGGGQHTSPDLTAAHWQQGDQGGGYGGGQGAGGRRPWWRSPFTLAAAVVVLLGGGGAAYYASSHGGKKNNPPAAVPLTIVKPPGCSTAAEAAKNLSVKTQQVPVSSGNGFPFSVVPSRDGKSVFVITDTALKVYKTGPGGTLTPAGWQYPVGGNPGVATSAILTPDGKYVLVAANNGIQVVDASGAESGASSINVGQLTVPGLSKDSRPIGVAVTPDGKFAFVSLQFANQVGVFDLANALSTHDWSSAYLGSLNVGTQPVGLTVSPDGQTLYATNFVQDSPVPGQLSVIDVAKATTKGEQKSAIVTQVQAGCHPARVVLTGDGKTAWVTSRQSNVVLGFSTSLLRTDPKKALRAKVQVGQWPIGIALVNNESLLVISDNDGNDTSPTSTSAAHNLAVVDPAAALKGKPALLGYIPSGDTPRDVEVSPNGKFLYVIDRDGAQVQVVKLSTLPNP